MRFILWALQDAEPSSGKSGEAMMKEIVEGAKGKTKGELNEAERTLLIDCCRKLNQNLTEIEGPDDDEEGN